MTGRPVAAVVSALLAVLGSGVPGAIAAAGAAPASSDAVRYVRLVDAAAAALEASPPDPGRARADLAAAEVLSPAPGEVLGAVEADLARDPPDTADAVTRLRAIGGVLALPPGAEPGDTGAARSLLQEVYRQPEFSRLDQVQGPSLLSRIFDRLQDLAGRITRALGHTGSLVGGGAVLLAALLLTLRLVRGATGRRARRITEEPLPGGDDPDREWSAALAAAAAGDHREAVRRAFRSALLSVALRGRMPVDAAWTTRELLARAAADADLALALAPAASAFDRAWYSGTAVGEADWLAARDLCAAVRRLAGAPAAAA